MISCTEFIPLYSAFFEFLEQKGGHDAVLGYWYYLSDNNIGDKTNPHSLASFMDRDGPFEGACNYWKHTLSEEACDVLRIYDYENQYCYTHMRHCPSRGMLNALKHVEPYYDYCEHCNVIYQRVLDKYGLVLEADHSKIANAECEEILYVKGHRPTGDYKTPGEGKIVSDLKEEDNKYLHRDFHILGDNALRYCGEQYGDPEVVAFLTAFTKHYFAPQIEKIQSCGLPALKEWIERVYAVEESSEVLHTELSDGQLLVTVDHSPVIAYMKSLNQTPSKYYIEETRTLYRTIAESCGLNFTLLSYEEDGAAKLLFTKCTA